MFSTQMINVWGDGYPNYPDLIITPYITQKYHSVPNRYIIIINRYNMSTKNKRKNINI